MISFLGLLWAIAAPPETLTGDGPLDFRCDRMNVYNGTKRTVCIDNVVVRRGGLVMCCDEFTAHANEDWAWKRFVCLKNVRAHRKDEMLWSHKADYVLDRDELVLTGAPVLQRGVSVLRGKRILLNTESDRARVIEPTGRFEQSTEATKPPVDDAFWSEPLPNVCPLRLAKPGPT